MTRAEALGRRAHSNIGQMTPSNAVQASDLRYIEASRVRALTDDRLGAPSGRLDGRTRRLHHRPMSTSTNALDAPPEWAITLPGWELVERGLRDVVAGRRTTVEALLVAIGAPRLGSVGISIPSGLPEGPEHQLYELLRRTHGDAAHGRYNALIRRLVSFERAAQRATPR